MEKKEMIIDLLILFLLVSFLLDSFFVNLVNRFYFTIPFLFQVLSIPTMLMVYLVVSFYFFGEKKKEMVLLWGGVFFSGLITFILKFLVQRPRLMRGKFYFFGWPDFSFPSMHVTVAFAALPFLWEKTKKLRYVWLVFVVLVLLSRIFFNEHYLSDVVGGALIGYAGGTVVLFFGKKLLKIRA